MAEAACAAGHVYEPGNGCPDCRDDRRPAWSKRTPQKQHGISTGGLGRPQGRQRDGWRDQAACQGHDPAHWFADRREAGSERAKAVCAGCPVRAACLDYAVVTDQRWGVWGGLTADERGAAQLIT